MNSVDQEQSALKSTAPPPSLLTGEVDAAAALGVCHSTFRRMVAAGTITPVEIPGVKRKLFRVSDLELLAAGLAAKS